MILNPLMTTAIAIAIAAVMVAMLMMIVSETFSLNDVPPPVVKALGSAPGENSTLGAGSACVLVLGTLVLHLAPHLAPNLVPNLKPESCHLRPRAARPPPSETRPQ